VSLQNILLAVCAGAVGFGFGCWATVGFLTQNLDEVIARVVERKYSS